MMEEKTLLQVKGVKMKSNILVRLKSLQQVRGNFRIKLQILFSKECYYEFLEHFQL